MNDLTNISLFKNCLETKPDRDILLYNFYYSVLNGDYKNEIDEIRTYPERAKILKKNLPCLTISGTFKERNAEGLIKHSGRLCIDIDGKENPHIENFEQLRDTLGTWSEVEFAALSASGRGVFVVVVISKADKHLDQFKALEHAFKKYGIKIDTSCKDVSRLRFMTYDNEAIFNERVTPYRKIYQEPKQSLATVKRYQGTGDDLERAINEIVNKGIDITDRYENWYQIGCALSNEYGERGRDHFHRLSQIHPDYNFSDCDRQYDKCLKNPKRYSKRTIFYYKNHYNVH